MCGFVGAVFLPERQPEIEARIDAALGSIRHRGPDGNGKCVVPHGVFGHARLSIIDLSDAARQPMPSSDGRVMLVFNGEIYNYRELYDLHLQDDGTVNPHSDTSVLLGMYLRYGEGMLAHLNGMFAFAIWDARDRSVLLARDRFGEKPLYFSIDGNTLLFGSECRAIQQLAPGRFESIDSAALGAYLHLGSVHAPRTIFEGIHALPAAHAVRLSLDKLNEVRPTRYWRLGATVDPNGLRGLTLEDARTETQRLLELAMSSRLVSDVPVGLFLSGGLDSGSICSLAQSVGHSGMTGVFVDFAEAQFSEHALARATADRYGVHMHRVEVAQLEFLGSLGPFFASCDQPTSDGFNTYIVSQVAHRFGGKVWLSGVGGDELFGGYPLFDRMGRLRAASRWMQALAPRATLDFLSHQAGLPMRLRRAMTLGKPGNLTARAFQVARAPLPLEVAERLLAAKRRPLDSAYIDALLNGVAPETGDDFQYASAMESQMYMGGQLLRDMDNFSMAHSLELRAPFLDHRLFDYVYQLPTAFKRAGTGKKPLLTSSLALPLPDEVRLAPKRGFTFPLEVWMRREFDDAFDQVCRDPRLAGLLDIAAVRELWAGYRARQVHWSVVWIPFALGRWLMGRP